MYITAGSDYCRVRILPVGIYVYIHCVCLWVFLLTSLLNGGGLIIHTIYCIPILYGYYMCFKMNIVPKKGWAFVYMVPYSAESPEYCGKVEYSHSI